MKEFELISTYCVCMLILLNPYKIHYNDWYNFIMNFYMNSKSSNKDLINLKLNLERFRNSYCKEPEIHQLKSN